MFVAARGANALRVAALRQKLGRPKIDSATERKVRNQLAKGVGILKVARWHGAAHLKGASNEPARGAAMNRGEPPSTVSPSKRLLPRD